MVLSRKLSAAIAVLALALAASADPVTSYVGTPGATVTLLGPVLLSSSIGTEPAAPFVCVAGQETAMHYVRDTDASGAAGNGGVCVCAYLGESQTYAWATTTPGLACPQ